MQCRVTQCSHTDCCGSRDGTHLDFQASKEGLALRGLQLSHGAREQAGEDGPKVLVHLHPAGMQRLPLLLVQLSYHLHPTQPS